jgi:hypothetical protein
MNIWANGYTLKKKPIGRPLSAEEFEKNILRSLSRLGPKIRVLAESTTFATTFRAEMERKPLPDLGDPRAAGWTYLLNSSDPRRAEIERAIQPLAEWRGIRGKFKALYFDRQGPDQWFDWLQTNYSSIVMDKVPHYILILGGPDQVPFHFQAFLDTAASVGRIDFDSIADLEAYVQKILRIERAEAAFPGKEVVFFAPNYGSDDPTFYSDHYLARPIRDHVQNTLGFATKFLEGSQASKANLRTTLANSSPALVFTASHGLGDPDLSLDRQKMLNGAICCQNKDEDDWLLTADDIPLGQAFLEGSIFFQFACFGYGTPAQSDYLHWLGKETFNAREDFVAAIPKKLLAHPKGPLAYIGHVDTAWLHAFDDPDNPLLSAKWSPRISPFVKAIEMLLGLQPAGLAMADMNKRYDVCNALLANTFDRMQRGLVQRDEKFRDSLINTFITRSDAQNYMIFGDPAVSLRIKI